MADIEIIDLERDIQHKASSSKAEIKELGRKMYNAVIDGSSDVLENVMIEEKDDPLTVTSTGNTILHVAAKYVKKHVAEIIINKLPSLLYKTNMKGNTPLHIAASLGHLEVTKFLLESAKVQRDIEANTPLIKMLNREKDTALHAAARNGHYKIVKFLIDEDQGLTSLTNDAGESPLFVAVDRRFEKIAYCILAATPEECSYRGRKGMNVLHAAVIRSEETKGSRNTLEAILMKSPNAMLEAADEFGWIPIHYAAHFGHVEVVKLFLKRDISLAYKENRQGMSTLHISAKEGHVGVIKTLIAKCPDTCELLDNKNRTAVHVAAESGQGKMVKFFLETLAFQDLINEQDKDGNTPFHLAAMKEHYELLIMLANKYKRRIAWMAMNKDGMSTVDIIQSDNKRLLSKEQDKIFKKLIADEGSLERVIYMQTAKEQTLEADIAKEMPKVNLLVATIVATVTFAAVFQLPGGYDDQGLAVLRNNREFRKFMVFDSLAFGFSAVSIFYHFLATHIPKSMHVNYPRVYLLYVTESIILFMFFAFMFGMSAVLAEHSGFSFPIYVCIWSSFFIPMLLLSYLVWNSYRRTCST